MAKAPKAKSIAETYLIPLLLALVLITVSSFVEAIRITRLGEALILIAAILSGTFLTQYLAFRSLRIQERDALFDVLTNVAFADVHGPSPANGILSETEVLAIEACAKEIWVYAYDLNWEGPNSPFANVVRANLDGGVRYRYLVPEVPEILLRVEQIESSLSRAQRSSDLVRFRTAERVSAVMLQISVTIYNPTLFRHAHRDPSDPQPADTVVVLFPHLRKYTSLAETATLPFLAIRGPATERFQEEFVTQWDQANQIEPSTHDI